MKNNSAEEEKEEKAEKPSGELWKIITAKARFWRNLTIVVCVSDFIILPITLNLILLHYEENKKLSSTIFLTTFALAVVLFIFGFYAFITHGGYSSSKYYLKENWKNLPVLLQYVKKEASVSSDSDKEFLSHMAVVALVACEPNEAIKAIMEIVNAPDSNPIQRKWAAWGLGYLKVVEAIPLLKEKVEKDESLVVRKSAINALARIETMTAVQALFQLKRKIREQKIREEIDKALARMEKRLDFSIQEFERRYEQA